MNMTIKRLQQVVVLTGLVLPFAAAASGPIESGQWFYDTLSTNYPRDVYYFDARSNDTVVVRMACEDAERPEVPDLTVFDPLDNQIVQVLDKYTKQEVCLDITNSGWHTIYVDLPAALWTYSNELAYSVSILRMPDAPLSYADEDVGPVRSGEALQGAIDVGADLDAGTFAVSNQCRLQIRMGQGYPNLVCQVKLYGPAGNFIMEDAPPEYRAEITTPVLTETGIYTIVCNDHFNARGNYVISMAKIPAELEGDDPDVGYIINGETKTGAINLPGDLDVAWFNAVTGDVISISMTAKTAALNPIMELYDPDMNMIRRATDLFQQAVSITNLAITNGGKYTVILKDAEDRYNVSYDVALVFHSGPSVESLPQAPTSLVASDGSFADHIQITWQPANGALGYDIWRSYLTNESVCIVTNHAQTSYSDYDVLTNTYYYYRVKSRNTYGVSTNFSDTDSGWCGTTEIPVSNVRKAVLVGINQYSSAFPGGKPSTLYACVNDANGLKNEMLLGDPSNNWTSTDIQVLTDNQATKTTLRNALQTLAGISGAGDLVFYAQSSHGGMSGADTLVCAYDQPYYDYELAADLALFRLDTRVILVFDTCYSAGMFKDARGQPVVWPFAERVMRYYRGIKAAEYRARGLPLPRDFGNNIAFMTSCNTNELSEETSEHGVYIGYLLEACTLTNVDVSRDGLYSFKELHDYAATKTPLASSAQHPQYYNGTLLSNTIARAVGVVVPGGKAFIYNDFDADRISDIALYRVTDGAWYIGSLARWRWLLYGACFGGVGWRPVVGDYDGDGYADPTVYNESAGLWASASLHYWRILFQNVQFGGAGLRPIAGDYTGDGKFDGALYAYYNNGYWYLVSATGYVIEWGITWAGGGYTAVPGDYDGDGKADYALYHDATGYWFVRSVAGDQIIGGVKFGDADYMPVPGDYDGDGIFDYAVYHRLYGIWYIYSAAQGALLANGIAWGSADWQPVPGDYNGDGIYDLAIYNASIGRWMIRTLSGYWTYVDFGGPDYVPVLPSLW